MKIGPVLNSEVAIPIGMNATVVINKLTENVDNIVLLISNLWTYLLF